MLAVGTVQVNNTLPSPSVATIPVGAFGTISVSIVAPKIPPAFVPEIFPAEKHLFTIKEPFCP